MGGMTAAMHRRPADESRGKWQLKQQCCRIYPSFATAVMLADVPMRVAVLKRFIAILDWNLDSQNYVGNGPARRARYAQLETEP